MKLKKNFILIYTIFIWLWTIFAQENLQLLTSIQPTFNVPKTDTPSWTEMRCNIWPTPWKRIANNFCECPEWTKNIDWACESCAKPNVCCGIQLNTKVPFIGDCIEFAKKCINKTCPTWYKCDEESNKCRVVKTDPNQTVVDEEEAFPNLMGWLIKILVTIIVLWSFVAILAGGVMISAAWADEQRAAKGKKLIIDVVIALAILGASGVILRLINPSFFQ